MFKGSKNRQRRYNTMVGIDKVSDDTECINAIDSYKPSKNNSLTNTLMDSIGEEEFFNYSNSSDYTEDMDLLELKEGYVVEDVETDTGGEANAEEGKNTTLVLVGALVLGVVLTILINILL